MIYAALRRWLRQWLRNRLYRLGKLPVIVLGFAALLLTTDLPDTLKIMWGAGRAAASTIEQASQIKQPQQPKP